MARKPDMQPIDSEPDPDFAADGSWRAPVTPWSDPELALDCRRFRAALAAAIARLPEAQARAYRMRELEGRETPEICAALGVSENHLFVLLHRARLHLRRSLDREWFSKG
jgi:RNA polymerase sigma-70 factor (ECF subfamily)